MYQVIVIQENSYDSYTKLFNIASQAARAFLSDEFTNNAYSYEKYDGYFCVNPDGTGPKIYTNAILNTLSEETYMLGKKQFYIKETFEEGVLVAAEPVEDYMGYECIIQIEQQVYEEWMKKNCPTRLYGTQDIKAYITEMMKSSLHEEFPFWIVTKNDEPVACGFAPHHDFENFILTKDLTEI